VFLLALGAGVVPATVAAVILWTGDFTPPVQWTLTVLIVLFWVGFAAAVRSTVVRPLQTLANMQAAVREGDFSMRPRRTGTNDSLSELMYEVDQLSSTLQQQRLGAFEADALMRKVLSEIDVAVFTFNSDHRLRLINRAGERLIGQISERVLGKTASELNLDDLVAGDDARTMERNFPGGSGRWGIRRTKFRQSGVPHELVVVTDLSRALREEERQAWQRLVRVLGHELNNSLAPIKSIAHTLESLVRRQPRPNDWEDDVQRGLAVISERSEALARFVNDYSRLARLPKPNLQAVRIGSMIRRIGSLDSRVPVHVIGGPDATINADPDQLEQLLINILRNAIDASVETRGSVSVGWDLRPDELTIRVIDEGPGIANASNLFVPFFTTKQGGSGIGLPLSRQIAESHGGRVSLANRRDRTGCEAVIELPIDEH